MLTYRKLLTAILCAVMTATLLPTYPAMAYGEEDVVSLGDERQVNPGEHAARYNPELEGMHGDVVREPAMDTQLAAQATERLSFPDAPFRNFIWPVEQSGAICYLTDAGSGGYSLRKYDITSGAVTTFEDGGHVSTDCFVRDNVYYSAEKVYVEGVPTLRVNYIDLVSGDAGTQFTLDKFNDSVSAFGVDQRSRFYVNGYNSLRIYSSTGSEIYTGDRIDAKEFVGFDETNGNFYFRGTANWVYWGYDHDMACLKVGNFDGSTVVANDKSITLHYQSWFFDHYGCAEMLDGQYLADLSTFSDEQLAILDSHKINQADVTDTTTAIDLVTNGVSVTSVALPADTVVFGATTRPSVYENDVDVSSVGPRCAYLKNSGGIAVATGARRIMCFGLLDGQVRGDVTTNGDVYKLMTFGDEVVALERIESGAFAIERIAMREATKLQISGSKSVVAGASADYIVTADSDLMPAYAFSSSDPSVISVDRQGRASAWKAGTATITVQVANGLKASLPVTVEAKAAKRTFADVTVLQGAVVDNWNAHDYATYGKVVKSYIAETGSGVMRVQARDTEVLIENYDRAGKLLSTEAIAHELPLFGGFFAGSDAYYLVYGKENKAESDAEVVLRAVRYDKSWKRLKSCDVKGANTYIPFDAGSLSMTEAGGKLYVHTCHEMYASDDGLHHQANMTFAFNEADMTLVDSYTEVMNLSAGYVSHSFNQLIRTDGNYVYRADHGDAYPRGIAFSATPVDGELGDPVMYGTLRGYENDFGNGNYTGVSLGGFEVTETSALVAYNEDTDTTLHTTRNVKLCSWLMSGENESSEVVVLTSHAFNSSATCFTPQLVRLDGRHLLLMWAERDWRTGEHCMRFACVDHDGKIVGDVVKKYLPASDCQPIVLRDGRVGWFASHGSETKLYTVDPYDLEGMANDNFARVLLGTPFADVSDATAHVDDVYWLYMQQISEGWIGADGTRTFRPYAPVARADMAAFLFRLARGWGLVDDSWQPSGSVAFTDVNKRTAHYREIMWLAEAGVSEGWRRQDGTREFRPLANVARADMAAFLARLYRLTGKDTNGRKGFVDVTDKTPHADDIRWLAAAGVSAGWSTASGAEFRPYADVARADMAAFLHRL